MPSVRLFVGNLPYQATEDDLRTHFSQVGMPTQIVRPLDRETGLARSPHRHPEWLGLECGTVRAAVWMMRMMAAVNVLSRREGTVLFVPAVPSVDADGEIVSSSVALVHRLALMRGILVSRNA